MYRKFQRSCNKIILYKQSPNGFYFILQDVFIESGIVSEGSIKGVMSGKHYNRSLLCHKTMYEALQRLRFEEFFDSLDNESQEDISSFVVTMKKPFEE